MAKVILLCGKICSGKSHYAAQLASGTNAVILSCDELMIDLDLDHLLSYLDDVHRVITPNVKKYLYKKAVQIVQSGSDVILDLGFWSSNERRSVSNYFKDCGIRYEWHFINASDEDWKANIAERNQKINESGINAYFIDEGLLKKFEHEFEMPSRDEMDIWIENVRS